MHVTKLSLITARPNRVSDFRDGSPCECEKCTTNRRHSSHSQPFIHGLTTSQISSCRIVSTLFRIRSRHSPKHTCRFGAMYHDCRATTPPFPVAFSPITTFIPPTRNVLYSQLLLEPHTPILPGSCYASHGSPVAVHMAVDCNNRVYACVTTGDVSRSVAFSLLEEVSHAQVDVFDTFRTSRF